MESLGLETGCGSAYGLLLDWLCISDIVGTTANSEHLTASHLRLAIVSPVFTFGNAWMGQ